MPGWTAGSEAVGLWLSRLSLRPNPNLRLIGLIGGTGGASGSLPFLRDAPAGRLTVSITDVVERKTGSEMSAFAIDLFRSTPCLCRGCTVLGLKACALGVVGFETGGVWLAGNGGIGEEGCD